MNERIEQTQTQDNFEEACKKSGIEIIEVPPKQLDGTGKGAGMQIRTTAPSFENPWYISTQFGGYNPCIVITGNSCLPNCVGYAHSAFCEEVGIKDDARVPTCNAKDFRDVAEKNGLPTGDVPKVGAIIVWWSDEYGHVGIVTSVDGDSIVVAQSSYGGTRFFLTKHTKPYNIYGQTCIGFIYNPYFEGKWKKNDVGWWWDYGDGTYPIDKWEKINNKWYHFDEKGYMQTGWLKLSNGDFYLEPSGAMTTGWKKLNNAWYYFDSNGYMKTGWIKDKNKWYYLGNNGRMQTGWLNLNGKRYYIDESGAMVTGNKTVPCTFSEKGELI